MTPERVVVIAATARSGSALLGRGLATTGLLGDAQEHLNLRILDDRRQQWGVPRISMRGHAGRLRRRMSGDRTWTPTSRFTRRSMAGYLDRLAEDRTGPTGVLSFKAMWTQYDPVLLARGLDATYWGVPVHWVRIGRADRVRQAVSIVRAKQTGLWTADGDAVGEPTYDAADIAANVAAIARDEASWDRYLAGLGAQPFTVTYENLDADYDGVMGAVLSHLGVHAEVPPRQLRRQADGVNDEWVARFLAGQGHHR